LAGIGLAVRGYGEQSVSGKTMISVENIGTLSWMLVYYASKFTTHLE
jgi:hypothetical protein